jgi:hypothetical protein
VQIIVHITRVRNVAVGRHCKHGGIHSSPCKWEGSHPLIQSDEHCVVERSSLGLVPRLFRVTNSQNSARRGATRLPPLGRAPQLGMLVEAETASPYAVQLGHRRERLCFALATPFGTATLRAPHHPGTADTATGYATWHKHRPDSHWVWRKCRAPHFPFYGSVV